MGDFILHIALLMLLAVFAFAILRSHALLVVVVLSGAFSLTSAFIFVVLDAVDVAFTEAAVGAGIASVLALATITLVAKHERTPSVRKSVARTGAALAVATGLLLAFAVSDLPRFGEAHAPVHTHVAPHYLNQTEKEIGVPNIVTAVLASYRGYDTFGETVVVFTAAIGVLVILAGRTRNRQKKKGKQKNA